VDEWFYEWHAPDEFMQRHALVDAQVLDRDHRAGRNKSLREAWTLGLFALGSSATSLRLIRDDPPDGEVILSGRVRSIEIVEALKLGRRPHEEFKNCQHLQPLTISDWNSDLQRLEEAINAAVRKKELHKNYPEGVILLLYLNIGNDPRAAPTEIEETIRSVVSSSSKTFESIFVIWRNWLFGPKRMLKDGRSEIDPSYF